MTEMVMSGSMSGEGKRSDRLLGESEPRKVLLALGAAGPARHRAGLRLYQLGEVLELKVATSVCMFNRDRDERGDARRLVRETLDRFTEGHQTADLKAAREVLTTT